MHRGLFELHNSTRIIVNFSLDEMFLSSVYYTITADVNVRRNRSFTGLIIIVLEECCRQYNSFGIEKHF